MGGMGAATSDGELDAASHVGTEGRFHHRPTSQKGEWQLPMCSVSVEGAAMLLAEGFSSSSSSMEKLA